jgi:hypothetical protein
MSLFRRLVVKQAVLVAVVATLLLAGISGTGIAAAATGSSPTVPLQVDVTVTDFGGTLAVGGRVLGAPSAVTGDVGAAGEFLGNATVTLGRTELVATAAANATVESDVDDVLGTAMARGHLDASVMWMNQTYSVVRDGTLPALRPVAQSTVAAMGASGSASTLQGGHELLASSVWFPLQAGGGGFTITFWDLYWFMVNLLLGLVLVGVFPTFSQRVADGVSHDSLRTGALGLAVLVATPLVLLLFALSLFGLPLALVGSVLFVFLAWVGAIYGRFAVGVWLLDVVPRRLALVGAEREPIENRWAALLVGLVVVGLLIHIPYLGRVVDVVVIALGLGAIAQIVFRTYRRTERSARSTPSVDTTPVAPTSPVDTTSVASEDS